MVDVWRLIDSGDVPPPESAAIDDAILASHSEGAVPDTLHFYVRSQPTVSIGYFQKAAEAVDLEECGRRGVAIVRRRSGGGTIYTDPGQLVFAVVASSGAVQSRGSTPFSRLCEAVAAAIGSFGVEANYRPMNDVEVGGRKISGSAQLRRHGSVLHHGTILVDSDLSAMDSVLKGTGRRPSTRVTTLAMLLDKPPTIDEVKASLASSVADAFGAELRQGPLTEKERESIASSARERYSKSDWNLRI